MRRRTVLTAVVTAGALLVASPSVAEPATTVRYPPGATATRYAGDAFDTCTAPSSATVRAWRASPYRALGIYIGGVTRSCKQPELTPGWVSDVTSQGWRLVPIYKGLQPWCGARLRDAKITPAGATGEGTAAGVDAVASAQKLGIAPGSGIYLDIENYPATDTACRTGVLQFTSAYTKALHRRGFVSGVYANLSSGAQHLSQTYASATYARPDALWVARYDRNPSLTGWTGIPDRRWAVHQRAKQYRGGHDETYGGVTLNIDNDRFDGPVATVARSYTVTSTSPLNARSAPTVRARVVATHASGSSLPVVCQAPGSTVATTSVWDQLTDGTYVTDHYVSTPSSTSYSAALPRCTFPFQVTAPDSLIKHTGPGVRYATAGAIPPGGLAWVGCQGPGSAVGPTTVWDRLRDGRWVTDRYVASPGRPGYSPPVPRC